MRLRRLLAGPPRLDLVLLAVIAAVGLLRGGYWALTTEVYSPIDELQHLAYVADLAEGRGLPVAGEDTVPSELLVLLKESHSGWWRGSPGGTGTDGTSFGLPGQQYEGAQPPVYYALSVPAWWAGQLAGTRGALLAVRLFSVLLALLAVPAVYVLGRTLWPRRRLIHLGAPLLLVIVQGFNGQVGVVTNDTLVPTAGAAMLVPAALAWRRGPDRGLAIATGVVAGLAVLVKTNLIVVLPLVIALLADAVRRHEDVGGRDLLRWLGLAAAAGGVTLLPWVAWNLVQYGEPSGAAVVHDMIMRPLQPPFPGTPVEVLLKHARNAVTAFWTSQLLPIPLSHAYRWVLFGLLVIGGPLGAFVAWRRGRRDEATGLLVTSLAFPTAFVGLLVIIFTTLDGASITVGRLLYPALAVSVTAIVAAISILAGRRLGVMLLATLGLVLLIWEAPVTAAYADRVYAQPGVVQGGLVPVVEQSWNGGWVAPTPFRGTAGCPIQAVSVTFRDRPPPERLRVEVDGEEFEAPQVAVHVSPLHLSTSYVLPEPATSVVVHPDAAIGWSPFEREAGLDADREGDPVAALLCAVDDPAAVRFDQRFDPDLPAVIDHVHTRVWPWSWVAIGAVAWSVAVAWALRGWRPRRPTRPE